MTWRTAPGETEQYRNVHLFGDANRRRPIDEIRPVPTAFRPWRFAVQAIAFVAIVLLAARAIVSLAS